MIMSLNNMGFMDTVLPFMLVFTVIYAVMVTISLQNFSEDDKNKKFALIVALVAAFGVVIPHATNSYPMGYDPVNLIMGALPNVALVAVAIIGLFIILGMFGIKLDLGKGGAFLMPVVVITCIIAIIFIFGSQVGWFTGYPRWLSFLFNKDTQALVVVLLVFGLMVWFITKEPKTKADKDYDKANGSGTVRFLKALNEGLGNKKNP